MADLRGGIDLGGTKIQTAIVAAAGEALGEARHPTPTSGGPEDVAKAMEAALREAATGANVEPNRVTPYGFVILPKTDKPILVEHDVAGHKAVTPTPPDWQEAARLPASAE